MIICQKCGFGCEDGSKFCTECATKLEVKSRVKQNFVNNTKVLLADGEVNVKSYHCTTFPNNAITRFLSFANNGYISVTNKRVIFYADGGKGSTLSNEVDISKITGVNSYIGRGVNLLALAFWLFVYIIQIVIIGTSAAGFMNEGSIGLLFLALINIGLLVGSIRLGYVFIRPWLYGFILSGDGVQVTPVCVGNIDYALKWWVTGQGAIRSKGSFFPGPDNQKALREVGALIKDIQTLGEYGVEKWIGNDKVNTSRTKINIEKEEVAVTKGNDTESDFFA